MNEICQRIKDCCEAHRGNKSKLAAMLYQECGASVSSLDRWRNGAEPTKAYLPILEKCLKEMEF